MRLPSVGLIGSSMARVILTSAVTAMGVTAYGLLCGAVLWLDQGLDSLPVAWLERFFVSGAMAGAIVGVLMAVDHARNFTPTDDSLVAKTDEVHDPTASDERLPGRALASASAWFVSQGHGSNGNP